jgi:hypothetical protein
VAGLTLVLAPAAEPVTLAEATLFARIDVTDDNALVTDLIAAARRLCEERRSWAYLTQTWDYFLDFFPVAYPFSGGWSPQRLNEVPTGVPSPNNWWNIPISLPRAPVQSVTTISYTKSDGTPVVISASDYQLDVASTRLARIVPQVGKFWPTDLLRPLNGVAVRFLAGYGASAASVPEHMRLAMKQLVAFWYRNRDAIGTLPPEIDDLLSETVGGFMYA